MYSIRCCNALSSRYLQFGINPPFLCKDWSITIYRFCALSMIQLSSFVSSDSTYHYFRSSNFDAQIALKTNISSPHLSATRTVTWNTTFRNFDSPRDVYVTRFDIFHENGHVPGLRLGGNDGMLRLPNGPAYIFTTANKLDIEVCEMINFMEILSFLVKC